jgi:hypothetical protein
MCPSYMTPVVLAVVSSNSFWVLDWAMGPSNNGRISMTDFRWARNFVTVTQKTVQPKVVVPDVARTSTPMIGNTLVLLAT